MEKIGDILKDNAITTADLKEEYLASKKDEIFKKIVSSLDLSDDTLMLYTSSLENSVKETKKCQECKGIATCSNEIYGYIYSPKVVNNGLFFEYNPCKYTLKMKHENEYKNNIDFYEMPPVVINASFKNIWVKDKKRVPIIKYLTDFVKDYQIDKHKKGLYLSGSFGSGKTYLIAALLNELAKKNIKVAMVYYPEFLRSLKATFENNSYNSSFNYIKKVPVLFLDDIGAESVSSWARDEVLGSILQYRMEANLPTFFTSNLTIDELEQHLSQTKQGLDSIKSRRIIERIKYLTIPLSLISTNNRQNDLAKSKNSDII